MASHSQRPCKVEPFPAERADDKKGLLVVPGHECLCLGVKIGRAARVSGRLIDEETEQSKSGFKLNCKSSIIIVFVNEQYNMILK
jgi:hypothetical protein